jgi:hypothetical protein
MLSAEAKRIAAEASRQGMWLYDPSFKKWYHPEEFEHIFTYANAKDEFLKQLQIKNPEEGIKAGFQQLTALEKKLQIFILKVNEYYRKPLKL